MSLSYYQVSFTKKRAKIAILFTWILGFTYKASHIMITSGFQDGRCRVLAIYHSPNAEKYVGIFVAILEFFLPAFCMIIAYARIIIHLMSVKSKPQGTEEAKHVKKSDIKVIEDDVQKVTQSNTDQIQNSDGIRKNTLNRAQKNLTKTMLYVCGAFILCWTGNELYVLLHYVWRPFKWSEWYYHLSVLAVCANGTINPYIYCLQYDEARDNLRKIFCARKIKKDIELSSEPGTNTTIQNSI